MSLTEQQRKRIVDRHRDALLRFGVHPHALYWSNREIQETRFRVLAQIGIEGGASLLDVGCGFGDLYGYLLQQGIETHYTGLDLSPELLAEARRLHPQARFIEGDLFDLDPAPGSYDIVVLSGALNEQLGDDGAYARRVIEAMFRACRRGVAFNLLDARHPRTAACSDLQSFDPDEMLAWCQGLADRVDIVSGYLDNDFSVYLRRHG